MMPQQPHEGQPSGFQQGRHNLGPIMPSQSTMPPRDPATPTPMPIPPNPGLDTDPRTPTFRRFPIAVTTSEMLPGAQLQHIGIVLGVVSRPRDLAHSPEISYITTEVRQDAIAAMVKMAQDVGAEAVVGLRFDAGYVTDQVSEVTAYGTAVRFTRY